MILFKTDWLDYPSAIVHLSTTNTSFLETAALYRDMGIENHAFILALVNPDLEFVDPHDPDIDEDTMKLVLNECIVNPWYYFREVAMAPPSSGTKPVRFRANRANMAAFWLFFNHVMYILIQPRQTGKSFSIDTLNVGLMNLWCVNTAINMVTRSDDLRSTNLARIKKIQEELPFYISRKSKGDIFNTEEIKINAMDNSYKGQLSNASAKLAQGVARGFTSPIFHGDEIVYVPNIGVALSGALMAGNDARDQARLNGSPYGTILTTTAGDIDDRDGQYVYNLLVNATMWNEIFFDCKSEEDLVALVLANSRAEKGQVRRPLIDLTFNHRQLGYDDDWMRRKIGESLAEGGDADRDLFNIWKSGSSGCPIPPELAEIIRRFMREGFRAERFQPYNCLLRWYISEEEVERRTQAGHSFIAGVDTSDAGGRDDIAMVVRDHTNAEVICAATFNEINLLKVADIFVSILARHRNMIMIIERKSSAPTIIDIMVAKLMQLQINPLRVLFNQVIQLGDQNDNLYNEVKKSVYYNEALFTKVKTQIGFNTSGTGPTARSDLYGPTLMSACKYSGRYMYDHQLCTQTLGLVERGGRIDHPIGGKDDLVMASLLSYWFIINGRNMDFYGIDRSMLLRSNEDYLREKYSEKTMEKEDLMEKEEELNELIDTYKNEKSRYVAAKLEMKIKMLASQLSGGNSVSISVEQMLDEINRQARFKRM